MQCNYMIQGSPGSASPKTQDRTTVEVSPCEDIIARTLEHEPHNDAFLHGRVRLCRVCRAETTNDRLCDACIEAGIEIRACERCKQTFTAFGPEDALCLQCLDDDARREEMGAALAEMCRIHRVRFVEDLPVGVLEEMQAERRRC